MDRQALLEQKRQRLQELKQRRSELQKSSGAPLVSSPPVLVKVDFAVQVDLPASKEIETVVQSNGGAKECRLDVQRFDKGVQTSFEEIPGDEVPLSEPILEDEIHEENEQTAPDMVEPTHQDMVEDALEEQLSRSVVAFKFSNLRLGVKDPGTVEVNTKEPFNVVSGLTGFLDRPITSVSTIAKFPELMLVAYGKRKAEKVDTKGDTLTGSPGLAAIFNRNAEPMVPEFFLQCTSTIAVIEFSTADPFKILAGLDNGRVVVWNLTDVKPTQIAILPTLQTTTLAASTEASKQRYIHHTSPIVRIHQLDANNQLSSGIISVSSEGIINLWSPNFLAFPKLDTVRLSGDSGRLKDQLSLTDAVVLLSPMRFSDEVQMARSPELRFLNQTVVGSKNGHLYRLSHIKDKNYTAISYPATGESTLLLVTRSVTSMAELKVSSTVSVIISGHNDWHLRIWDLTKLEPVANIPTATVVTKIYVRPGYPFHIVTLGSVNPPKLGPCVQFWDLKVRLMSPVSTFALIDKTCEATTACFSPDGAELIVAFADGDVRIWEIEETRLETIASLKSNFSIDEGILPLLRSM